MSGGIATRRAALVALQAVDEDDAYANFVVPDAIADLPEVRDRAFAANLAYGTLRWQGTLDWALSQVLTRPLNDVEPALLRVLRLGAFQIMQTQTATHAAVDTSVDLARTSVPKVRAKAAGGFVNGVLRNLARREASLPWPDEAADPIGSLALRTAHPRWSVEDAIARFGYERATSLLEGDNQPPGLTLRACGDRAALVEELCGLGFEAEAGVLAPEAVRVPGADPRRLQAVIEGRAVPQDEASMLVTHATGVKAGDRVLDLCAGPGGKATHLAALAGPGRVTAIELYPHRAELIRGAARRQGIELDVQVADATTLPVAAPYDVVLLDAPCSGLGTGRRRPEVRWRRTPEDVASLVVLQEQLLDAALLHVAPGGRLTYAVCTWTQAETDGVLDAALIRHGARLEVVSRTQFAPDSDDTDGMFVASLRVRA